MNGVNRDELFNLDSVNNRDNGHYSWVILRDAFKERGYSLHTADVNADSNVACELHIDVQFSDNAIPCYLLMLETPQVWPANGDLEKIQKYRKVFTWNDSLVDQKFYIKANFPNIIKINPIDGFSARDHFCCLIAGNKAIGHSDRNALYSERVKSIRWFENNAPDEFSLYGVGWEMPEARSGLLGKILRYLWRSIGLSSFYTPFPSYRGKLNNKSDALKRTRFSICYENIADVPGYITEKIFDSFFSGCIPIYWGANNITDYIPDGCFIDRRKFSDTAAVYEFLKNMTENQYCQYQNRISEFLNSDVASQFSAEFLANKVVNTVVNDLES